MVTFLLLEERLLSFGGSLLVVPLLKFPPHPIPIWRHHSTFSYTLRCPLRGHQNTQVHRVPGDLRGACLGHQMTSTYIFLPKKTIRNTPDRVCASIIVFSLDSASILLTGVCDTGYGVVSVLSSWLRTLNILSSAFAHVAHMRISHFVEMSVYPFSRQFFFNIGVFSSLALGCLSACVWTSFHLCLFLFFIRVPHSFFFPSEPSFYIFFCVLPKS